MGDDVGSDASSVKMHPPASVPEQAGRLPEQPAEGPEHGFDFETGKAWALQKFGGGGGLHGLLRSTLLTNCILTIRHSR